MSTPVRKQPPLEPITHQDIVSVFTSRDFRDMVGKVCDFTSQTGREGQVKVKMNYETERFYVGGLQKGGSFTMGQDWGEA